MIQVTTDEFIAICFLIVFIILTGLMLYMEFYKAKQSKEEFSKGGIFMCKKCKHHFISENRYESIARCPKCNQYCFLKKVKRF